MKPEATIELDGTRFPIGGLTGQQEHAYLQPEWLETMTTDPSAFQYAGYTTGAPTERFAWKRVRYYNRNLAWPPHGVSLTINFRPPDAIRDKYPNLIVSVHYELYDGIPALCKWLSVQNGTNVPITIKSF